MKAKRVYTTIMTVLVLLTVLLPVNVAALSTSSITMVDVTPGVPVVGGPNFETDIVASISNNGNTPIFGVQGIDLWIPFDATRVDVANVTFKNGFFDGGLIPVVPAYIYDAVTGQGDPSHSGMPPECTNRTPPDRNGCVQISVVHVGGQGPVTNRAGVVATITWTPRAAGDAGFLIATNNPSYFVDDGFNFLASPPHPATVVTPLANFAVYAGGIITGRVTLQGQDPPFGNSTNTVINVTASCDNGGVVSIPTGTNGDFTLVVPGTTTCDVTATYNGYLTSERLGIPITPDTYVDIDTTRLLGGDVDANTRININDARRIFTSYEDTAQVPGVPEDINDDGTVNIRDLAILAGNFNRSGPTIWSENP